jgi:uncharacterized membrane protein YfcA
MVILAWVLIACLVVVFFSNNAKRVSFALDTTKMLLGFFVGVATGFIGETTH